MSPETMSTISAHLPLATKHVSSANQLVHVPPRVTHTKNGPGTNSSIAYFKEYGSSCLRSLMDDSPTTVPSIPPQELQSVWTKTFHHQNPIPHVLSKKSIKILSEILLIPTTHYIFTKLKCISSSPRVIVNLFGSDCESLDHTLGLLGPTCVFRHAAIIQALIIYS